MVTHFSLMSHQDHSLAIKRVNGLAFMHHFSSLMDHSKWFKSTLACTVEELGLKHLINGGLGLPPEEQLFKVTCPQRYTGQKKRLLVRSSYTLRAQVGPTMKYFCFSFHFNCAIIQDVA